jgi:hypothetical protein
VICGLSAADVLLPWCVPWLRGRQTQRTCHIKPERLGVVAWWLYGLSAACYAAAVHAVGVLCLLCTC